MPSTLPLFQSRAGRRMHVQDALDRLDQIHDQIARSEVYRGLRVPTVAVIGALGLLAAAVQPYVPGAGRAAGFVGYWTAVAVACGTLGAVTGLRSYLVRDDGFARRRARRMVVQFLPGILAGAAVTAAVTRDAPAVVPFLPAVWAILFGLGVAATSPFLPPELGPVGFGYVAVGMVMVLRTDPTADPSPWAVGGVFGLGHIVTAAALWRGKGDDDD